MYGLGRVWPGGWRDGVSHTEQCTPSRGGGLRPGDRHQRTAQQGEPIAWERRENGNKISVLYLMMEP